MRVRRTDWLAMVVIGTLFCGVCLGLFPVGQPLLPLRQIQAQYQAYDVSILFPMWEANSIYVASAWWQNTTFLPVRVDAQPVSATDYVTFWLDGVEFDVDDEAPFIGYLLGISAGIGDSFDIEADASYTNDLLAEDWVEIHVDALPDADQNGVPEDQSGVNDPLAVPIHGVYIGQVPSDVSPTTQVVFSAVASVGDNTMGVTNELAYLVTGSDVTLAVPNGAVPDTDGRIIVRTATSPADIDADLGDLGIPSGPGVVPIVAIDAHLVDSTGAEVDELEAPIFVCVPILPIPPGFPQEVSRIGIPIFYAETDLDTDYNATVPVGATSFEQLEVQQIIGENEVLFSTTRLTMFVPMFHLGAPVILDIEPDNGPLEGGTPVTVLGAGYLDEDLTVTFRGEAGAFTATDVNVVYDSIERTGTITCVTPAYEQPDLVDVRITNPEDDQGYALFAMLQDAFEFDGVEAAWDGGEGEGEPAGGGERGGRGGAGPCFVATATYGSNAAHELETLRTFRDNYLLTNAAGTALVKAYYRHSPSVAMQVVKHPASRLLARVMMSAVVGVAKLVLVAPMWMKLALASLALAAAAGFRNRSACYGRQMRSAVGSQVALPSKTPLTS